MRIIIDEYNLESFPGALIVQDINSFILARKQILNYKTEISYNKTILVIKHPYTKWFSDIETEEQIFCEKILPSKKLLEKFGSVNVDAELKEEDIIKLKLLQESIEPTEIAIINKFIGPFLLNTNDLNEQLYQITSFVVNLPKHFTSSLFLQDKWKKYLHKIESETSLGKLIITQIQNLNVEFCKICNQLIYVAKSKILLKEWIHDNKEYLESVIGKQTVELESLLSESQFSNLYNEQFEYRMESFFKTYYREDLSNFFNEKSTYKASLKAFLSLSKSITDDQKAFILNSYSRVLDDDLRDKIHSLVKPILESPPNLDGLSLVLQAEAWHNWAVKSFIPFKFYLDEFPNPNDIKIVEEHSNRYSDWLYNSYENIIQSGIKTNYQITSVINHELISYKVVWLIIDGFPFAYSDVLNSILKDNGINKIANSSNFAALPTITQIGIPTQLSGTFPNERLFTNNREEALRSSFKFKNIIFKNSIKDFSKALESDYDVCCLHWQEIDEFMHKEDGDIDGRRIDEIKRLLKIRIKQIADFIKINVDQKIKLIISTDHGSTKCLTKGLTIKNSSLIEACKDNPKERCLELSGPLLKANIDEDEVYYLKSEHTKNICNWVAARGYRYFGRFDYGYRHGGLSPEETIVPFLNCEMALVERLPITIYFNGEKDLKVGYVDTLRLLIKNDNDAIIEIHKISILEDPNFNLDFIPLIQPLSNIKVEGKIKLQKGILIKNGKSDLNVSISYSIMGDEENTNTIIKIPIEKSNNEEFENLFK